MKVGFRKPSLRKSIKARTTGRAKRAVKSAINPLYGKKGMGWINDPKRAAYNKVYNKTTIGISDIRDKKHKSSNIVSSIDTILSIIKLIIYFGFIGVFIYIIINFLLIFI